MIELLDVATGWGFELSKEEAQNRMHELLDEYVGGLEKYLWGNGAEKKVFPPSLITLAGRLGFNVDRFLKIN